MCSLLEPVIFPTFFLLLFREALLLLQLVIILLQVLVCWFLVQLLLVLDQLPTIFHCFDCFVLRVLLYFLFSLTIMLASIDLLFLLLAQWALTRFLSSLAILQA